MLAIDNLQLPGGSTIKYLDETLPQWGWSYPCAAKGGAATVELRVCGAAEGTELSWVPMGGAWDGPGAGRPALAAQGTRLILLCT